MGFISDKIRQLSGSDVHLNDLLKGSFAPMLSKMLGMVAVFVFHVIISQKFGSHEVGIFAIGFTAISIISILVKTGFDTAIVKFISESTTLNNYGRAKSVYRVAISVVLVTGTITGLLVFLLQDPLSRLFFQQEYISGPFLIVALAILPHAVISINAESLRGIQKMAPYSLLQQGTIYLFALFILYFLLNLFPGTQFKPLWSFYSGLVIVAALSFLLWFRNFNYFGITREERFQVGVLLKTSLPMFLSNAVFFVMSWADVIMLGIFEDESGTGIYHNCLRVSNLMVAVLFAVNAIAAPKFASLKAENDMVALKTVSKNTSLLNIMFSLPVLLAIVIFPGKILSLFGQEFVIGATVLIVLAIGQFFNAISGSVINLLNMTGKEKVARNIILFAAVVNIILNYVLIPRMGIMGAAIATTTSIVIWNLLAVVYIYVEYKFLAIYIPFIKK